MPIFSIQKSNFSFFYSFTFLFWTLLHTAFVSNISSFHIFWLILFLSYNFLKWMLWCTCYVPNRFSWSLVPELPFSYVSSQGGDFLRETFLGSYGIKKSSHHVEHILSPAIWLNANLDAAGKEFADKTEVSISWF